MNVRGEIAIESWGSNPPAYRVRITLATKVLAEVNGDTDPRRALCSALEIALATCKLAQVEPGTLPL